MLIRKTHTSSADGDEFILSDATPDRYGDVIMPDGWVLDNFKKNSIALFGHQSAFPIGSWKDLQVKNGALRGRLVLAPAGTSARINEVRRLVEAGVLKAVSVGFVPLESEPLVRTGGTRFLRAELVECSLVSVPANPAALMVSKALNISRETMQMVFEHKSEKSRRGSSVVTVNHRKNLTINERIAKMRRTAAVLERAKAVLEKSEARHRADQARALKQKSAPKPAPKPKPPEPPGGITWRGQKIPASWFYEAYRKRWGDRNS